MNFLFSGRKNAVPALTGLSIQTAVNMMPIPIVYGCPRIGMNIIYVNGFKAVATSGSSGGGKGLLSGGKGETSGYDYFSTFIGALCEGPGNQLLVVFDNQQTYTPSTAPDGKIFQAFNGTSVQTPWSVISSSWPADAFGYRDTAYIGFGPDWPLDSSATIPQLNFIFQGVLYDSCPLNRFTAPNGSQYFLDADPGQCVLDFLTNERYGVGFPLSLIDVDTLITTAAGFNPLIGDIALSTYCQAVGLGWAVALSSPEPAGSILDRWLKNLVVAPVWNGSILRFIPYRDTFADVNPGWDAAAGIALKYYTPDIPVLFDLTSDDFIQAEEGDDPVLISRIDISDVKNIVRLDFRDRYNLFNDSVSEAKDEALVETVGPRIERLGIADEFSINNYANVSVQMQLQRGCSIRNIYEFRLGWHYCILDPMDIVTLTEPTLGLSSFPVRIRSIEEDEKGILTIIAEEFRLGAGSATVFDHQTNEPPTLLQLNVPPPNINDPIMFEPTVEMRDAFSLGVPTVMIALSGGPSGTYDPNWGGSNVWLSTDDITFAQNGFILGPSRMGDTTNTVAAFFGTNPDTTNILGVDVSESNATLESATPDQAAAGLTLCAIVEPGGDYELVSYTTATLTGPGLYDLTDLYRGLYGTVACGHPSGSRFVRVDQDIFRIPLPTANIGQIVYAKFPSFNIFSLEVQDLSDVPSYQYTAIGSGFNIITNPVISALLASQAVDLQTAGGPSVDLNIGGGGACAPISISIDLESL